MKRSLGASEWIRRGLGATVLVGVFVIAMGFDTGFLTQLSLSSTASLEQRLLDKLQPDGSGTMAGGPAMMSGNNSGPTMMAAQPEAQGTALPVEGRLPALSGAVEWLNSPPLSREDLRGKVVLIDFWTYSCINCLRTIPYLRAWYEKYKDQGFVILGVHSPEFAFEKNIANVKKATADLGITYPVAIDNNFAIWRSFFNQYWPAHYFIDAEGRIRYHHFGEGNYAESERVIQQLLQEAGKSTVAGGLVTVNASGTEAASDLSTIQSPETYIGYKRAENFVSPGAARHDAAYVYTPGKPRLNEWGLSGNWTISEEDAVLNEKDGSIVFRFRARDLHLVLGTQSGGPVRFRVTIDGKAPGDNHGTDTDRDGQGMVTGQRLYQLVRQQGEIADHTFEIQFLDPGVQAYAFTFG